MCENQIVKVGEAVEYRSLRIQLSLGMSSKHHLPEAPGNVATECKHRCKDKEACGHPCCKRHFSPIVQLKAAQRLSNEPASKSVECRHTCRDKLACGHQCCKRHLSREASETVAKQQPSLNLQVVKQATRKSQMPTTTHSSHQVRRASSGPQLAVQGRAVAKTQEEPQARNPDANPKFHFFIYDIESTGVIVKPRLLNSDLLCSHPCSMNFGTHCNRHTHSHHSRKLASVQLQSTCYNATIIKTCKASAMTRDLSPSVRTGSSLHLLVFCMILLSTFTAAGLSPTGDRIVEIAMKDGASCLEYATLVSCAPATVHRGAYQAHGISTRQSHEHGLPFKYVLCTQCMTNL